MQKAVKKGMAIPVETYRLWQVLGEMGQNVNVASLLRAAMCGTAILLEYFTTMASTPEKLFSDKRC